MFVTIEQAQIQKNYAFRVATVSGKKFIKSRLGELNIEFIKSLNIFTRNKSHLNYSENSEKGLWYEVIGVIFVLSMKKWNLFRAQKTKIVSCIKAFLIAYTPNGSF